METNERDLRGIELLREPTVNVAATEEGDVGRGVQGKSEENGGENGKEENGEEE